MSRLGTWELLIHTLRFERDAYQELCKLLIAESQFLCKMDHQRLVDINHQKENILNLIHQYEQERTTRFKELAGFSDPREVLAWLSGVSSPEGDEAEVAFHELVDVGKRVKQQGQKNAALTFRALHIVREALCVLYNGLGAQPVYQGSGQLSYPSVVASVNLQG